jgi:8-oxo-dGTP diphosphatase
MPVTTEIHPPGRFNERELTYVVIGARYMDRWIFVRHRDRSTWEMPAGHIEKGESADRAAVRELFEETGAVRSHLEHICDYAVVTDEITELGRLYSAEVQQMEEILKYETAEILLSGDLPNGLTYPEVQAVLFQKAREHLR